MSKYRRWIKKFLKYYNSGTFWVQCWTPDNIAGSVKQKEGLCNSATKHRPHWTIFQTSRGKYLYVCTIWFTRQEKLIATFVIEFQFFCTQPSGRTHWISLRSRSEWSSQYHQENFWHLIAQYFRQLYYVLSFDRLIDAISTFYHALDFQYFLKYWKEPITHLAILSQPPSHCSLTVKTNWYCSCRMMPIRFVWHRKVYGPVLHWTEGQSEFSTIGDLLMLPRAFKNLGLPSFNSVAFPSLSLQWNRAFELDIVYNTWTRWRKPAASLDSGKYILSAAIVLGSNIARALPTFCLEMPGWRFAAVNFGAGYLFSSHFFSFS